MLIQNGVLTGLLTTKKTAGEYGLKNLGNAEAPYDGVPSVAFHSFRPEETARTLKELLPGKAVYVVITSGGDMTPDGHFAAPVQMAYLMEDGRLVGRLPDISVSGDFFDLPPLGCQVIDQPLLLLLLGFQLVHLVLQSSAHLL